MKSLAEHMALYGRTHRDPRNKATRVFVAPVLLIAVAVIALGLERDLHAEVARRTVRSG